MIALYTAILGILVPSGGGKWLVDPFFMLPLLAVLGPRARDLIEFTFLQFMFHLPVVLLLLWLLGMTFEFEKPMMP